MRKFFALLRIQLLARYADLKPSNLKKITDPKEKKKARSTILAYILVAVMFAGMIIPYELFMMNLLSQLGMEEMLPALAVTLSMVCTLIMSFFFIMTSLYFGKDAAYLAAMPIKSRTVLSAKLTQVWISETLISTLFILPASIIYGIRVGVDALFYLRMVPVWLTVSILPICIVAFLSTLLIRLSSLWKHRETMMTVGGILMMLAYFVFVFAMSSGPMDAMEDPAMMMQLLTDNKATLQQATRLFPPAVWLTEGLLGDWGQLALGLAVNAAAAVFTVLALSGPYRKLSLLQTQVPENKKVLKDDKHFRSSTPFMACFKREWRQICRVSTYALNTFPTAFMPVIFVGMIGYMLMSEGGAGELKTALSTAGLPGGLVAAVLAGLMCFMAGINPAIATAVSREGRNGHGMLTSLPVKPQVYAKAKMAVGMLLSVSGVTAASIVAAVLVPGFLPDIAVALVIGILYCLITNALSLLFDIRAPKLDWMTETEAIKQGTGTLKGMLVGLGILLAVAGASVGLFLLNAGLMVYGLVMAAVLGVIGWLCWTLLMRTAEKSYWQD